MKSLLVNTYDIYGGAAIATYRLHRALQSIGVDSNLLVQRKFGKDPSVIGPANGMSKLLSRLRPRIDTLPLKAYPNKTGQLFSPAITPDSIVNKVNAIDPDIVHLFWVTAGFIRVESLAKLKKPVVWTLHDMWPFTGGCHYDNECNAYKSSCGNCPILGSSSPKDISNKLLRRKEKSWQEIDLTIVATSKWLADCAAQSTLFKNRRIEVIPNAFDLQQYKPIDKLTARHAYNLPQEKTLILFSSFNAVSDKRKGYQHLMPALINMTDEEKSDTELIILGAAEPETPVNFGMKAHYIEHLQDEISQVLLYSAADVLVLPSEQENLSNTVIESILCGTPVVAFNIGGMPDIIEHGKNGYLATPFDSADLAKGIWSIINNRNKNHSLSNDTRSLAKNRYNMKKIANEYLSLYQNLKCK